MSKGHSPAALAAGPLVFVSGQVPEAADGEVAEGDAAEQTRQIFRNTSAVLAEYGAELHDLVKLTYYLRHITDLAVVQAAVAQLLVPPCRPASTLVEVSGLIDTRYLLEIDAIAVAPHQGGGREQ
ncbi:RidA family protein [Salinactinospora qingdaonensis]|uniref:RidA family protein n=1 Tax=Salinactinospora qingdaonensis TaxID=702744 RepID=A0ABP7FRG5_9ACTN